jgi:soluble lytic murein transglycosylase
MSTQAPARTRPRSGSASKPRRPSASARRRQVRRRRLILGVAALVAALTAIAIMRPAAEDAVQEIALPLRHEDIIRQQAVNKGLDPSLIAGVIYVESHFRDQTSHAGAKGLMQLLPSTAAYIAHKSGGTRFEQGDLATPQINIAYGSWYLRYLLRKYDGNELLALAAYNAGEGKVDGWYRDAAERGVDFDVAQHIPFPETRDYVTRVLDARERYRNEYARELGL